MFAEKQKNVTAIFAKVSGFHLLLYLFSFMAFQKTTQKEDASTHGWMCSSCTDVPALVTQVGVISPSLDVHVRMGVGMRLSPCLSINQPVLPPLA